MLKFREIAISDRQTLERLLLQNLDAIEEGIEPVLPSPFPPQGAVSFILARDGRGRAVVIEYDIVADSTLLFHAIHHLDWFSDHLPLLSQLVPAGVLDQALFPRLALILPGVPPEMERSISLLNIQPECFIYSHLSADHQFGLWLKPYPIKGPSVPLPSFPKKEQVNLTEDEKAFFNQSP